MYLVVDNYNLFLIRKFVESGISINLCDKKGRTLLHKTIYSKFPIRKAVYGELIYFNVSTGRVEKFGISVLYIANKIEDHFLIEKLFQIRGKLYINIINANERIFLI
jgi:DNA helicase TIP49 (TBP-interacting protein)